MAIAFDQITTELVTPGSFAVTLGASATVLVVFTGGNGGDPTTMTYGLSAMTKQATATVPIAGDPVACWTLLNPPTGLNTLVSTGTTPTGTQALSYSGVGAVSGANSDTSGDPTTITFTVGVANSFVVGSGYGRNGPHAMLPSTGVANDRYGLTTSGVPAAGDSGAVSSNTSLSWANTGSPNPNDTASVGIVLEPSAVAVLAALHNLSLLGVGT